MSPSATCPVQPAKQASKYSSPLSPHTGLNSDREHPQLELQSFINISSGDTFVLKETKFKLYARLYVKNKYIPE